MRRLCQRCGVDREVNESRAVDPLCRDCIIVEQSVTEIEKRSHGTNAGYRRHTRLRDLACESCLAAHREWMTEWRDRTGRHVRRSQPDCGSNAGYYAHRRRGEEPCGACRVGQAEYQRSYYTEVRRRRKETAA